MKLMEKAFFIYIFGCVDMELNDLLQSKSQHENEKKKFTQFTGTFIHPV